MIVKTKSTSMHRKVQTHRHLNPLHADDTTVLKSTEINKTAMINQS